MLHCAFRVSRLCPAALIVFAALSATAAGDDPPTSLRETIDAAIDGIEVLPLHDEQPARPLVVLRWANNQRGSEDGLTILYIHQGRPLATACLYPWAGSLIHDLESLARNPIIARRKDEADVLWMPRESAVVFADIPEAPAPAATATQRLRQLKSLAEQFQSTMLGWKADATDREELRLLPRPLYRYETTEGPVIDGAVFGFVMGTDPESLLLIEAFDDQGRQRWQFGFARRTSGKLEGRHRDKVVWTADRSPSNRDPMLPHFAIGTPLPKELLVPPTR